MFLEASKHRKSPIMLRSNGHRLPLLCGLVSLFLILNNQQVPNCFAYLQQAAPLADRAASQLQPIFSKSMDSLAVKENAQIGDLVYTLAASIEARQATARIWYAIEGTNLFNVDKLTGQVRVAQPIDREQTSDTISLKVSATTVLSTNLPGLGSKFQPGPTTQISITVHIVDENDNPPRIELVKVGNKLYDSSYFAQSSPLSIATSGSTSSSAVPRPPSIVRLNVSESLARGSTIVDLIDAIDVDKTSDGPLSVRCVADCEPEFELQPISGVESNSVDRVKASLVLVKELQHIPRNNIRRLQIDIDDGKFNTSLLLEITIDDVQNKPPQFIGSSTCIVHENQPIDKTIMTIQALDGDIVSLDDHLPGKFAQTGRPILYDLVNQNDQYGSSSDEFKLHPLSGQLQVANKLDRESFLNLNGVLSLRVRARELTGPGLAPESLVALDESYDLILDKLMAYVDKSEFGSTETEITVILMDVNDNQPHWLNSSEISSLNLEQSPNWYSSLPSNNRDSGRVYHLSIRENSPPGTVISKKNDMFVYDLDNGQNSLFNLTIDSPFKNLFEVEPKQVSGFALVTLKLAAAPPSGKLLDYEDINRRTFIVQIVATETGSNERLSSRAIVHVHVLDVNDNAPEFKESPYHANIREDAPAGKPVLQVQAEDRDEMSKKLTFALHGKSAYLFDINSRTGLISVAKCNQTGSLVAAASLQPKSRQQQQQSVSLARHCIDYESQRSHSLMVEVSDGQLSSKVPLTIHVDDVSDNPPIFALPVVDAVIEEGAASLDPPIRIEATDADQSSLVTYSIIEGNFEGLFSVNNVTGEIQLTRPIRISHDDISGPNGGIQQQQQQQPLNKMTLIVQASDGLFVANGTVRIDVLDANDNPPKFLRPQYNAEIAESTPVGSQVISVLAIDSDRGNNARISYRIERGSFNQFEIDESTGLISVSREAQPFDANKRENYTLEVVAFDHGSVSKSSHVLVHIHLLDRTKDLPHFEPLVQHAEISETTPNGTVIRRMTLSASPTIGPQEELGVPPSHLAMSVSFELGSIEAVDGNGQPVAPSDRLDSMFSLTPVGEVIVSGLLDHDYAAYVNLTIFASHKQPKQTNNNNNSLTNVGEDQQQQLVRQERRSIGFLVVNIVDENNNAPVFAAPWSPERPELYFKMAEELPAGSVLAQLVASDSESKISHYQIEPPSEYFELASPSSGLIINKKPIDYDLLMKQFTHRSTVVAAAAAAAASNQATGGTNSPAPLRANQPNLIRFNLLAYDHGMPQLFGKAVINVEILPINDNDCKFEQPVYEAIVKENSPAETHVVQVRANDFDFGEQHNSVKYRLIGDYADLFVIDPRNGNIQVSKKGSSHLDRERLSRSTLTLTVVGRDTSDNNRWDATPSDHQQQFGSISRSCTASVKVYIDDVNDNPPLFLQRTYEVTAYDTDSTDVPLLKLLVRDDDYSSNSLAKSRETGSATTITTTPTKIVPINNFRIVSGNSDNIFNITNQGLLYTTKVLGDVAKLAGVFRLRVEVKQQSPNMASFTDECLVVVNVVKINRYGPEWRLDTGKRISVLENSSPGSLVTQLKCDDRDLDTSASRERLRATEDSQNEPTFAPFAIQARDLQSQQTISPIRYFVRQNGANLLETSEFKLNSTTGRLVTKTELDREARSFYNLVVVCEDNGKPQSLSSVTSIVVHIDDVDDNKPKFVFAKSFETSSSEQLQQSPVDISRDSLIRFAVEEHQGKGLQVGELKAVDSDIENPRNSITYCLIEGNEFQEFALDKESGILYTNQSLDREKQSSYQLLIEAINDGSTCEDRVQLHEQQLPKNLSLSKETPPILLLDQDLTVPGNKVPGIVGSKTDNSYLNVVAVKIDVLDINDNAPVFKNQVYRAGVHHRALMNSLITHVSAYDPDSGLNGTLNYKIAEILMYRSIPKQDSGRTSPAPSNNFKQPSEQLYVLSKPIKLIQFPFRIDQQGNLHTQQLLTQYQTMSMFVVEIEATEQAEPWRVARTKVEVYIYESVNQLKMRVNLHPRLVETYRSEIEALLSNATRYTAIINRARNYYESGASNTKQVSLSGQQPKPSQTPSNSNSVFYGLPMATELDGGAAVSHSNIHLIFVDNFGIVNPNLVLGKFDSTSSQLFMPQLLAQITAKSEHQQQPGDASSRNMMQSEIDARRLQVNDVSALVDKIALASVQAQEYQGSPSSPIGIDWLENPAVIYATVTIALFVIGFITFLFGCCCTSKIKDHIVKVAMDKMARQQEIQAKIHEQMLANSAGNSANGHQHPFGGNPSTEQYTMDGHDFINSQAGYMSSFDATKSCVNNNNDNLGILQRAAEFGEYIDPNYNTLSAGAHYNMGAHFYDTSELENRTNEFELSKHHQNLVDESNISISLADETEADDNDLANGQHLMGKQSKLTNSGEVSAMVANGHLSNANQRLRQQVPTRNQ